MNSLWWILMLAALMVAGMAQAQTPQPRRESVFYPPALLDKARANAQRDPTATAIRQQVIAEARPWLAYDDEALWELMFGNTIKRAWQVWSNGHCPACKQSVPMYDWQMDALNHPWKTRCPHCKELFPKNDFAKFYRSGLDERHVFDPKRADRSLLFNTEHPDPNDPLHKFGVDDGEGYVDGDKRWRFIGAYLIFGQWKQAIYSGILSLAAAYSVTGDKTYAHKAGVLLDRVADLYPTMDFGKEGVMYEGAPRSGYVSTWHDACIETRNMAIAYDQVRAALAEDNELAAFLTKKAAQYRISTPKNTPADVLRNIEAGILQDPQRNLDRIYCNYPQTEMTVAILKTVLDKEGSRAEVQAIFDEILKLSTAVDGVTGEKGLTGYAVFATSYIANVLALYSRAEPNFLPELLKRHPRLIQMFRFHIDTWCLGKYYPNIGDTGAYARPVEQYVGVSFTRSPGITPSMYSFLWQLYEQTKDPAFVQALYRGNDDTVDGLPRDLFASDPGAFRQRAEAVIKQAGPLPKVGSVNKQEWHLAILRGGDGSNARALWLDYDSGGFHAHADGLNIGLFAKGLDLLPDFGYPPVQYGGWGAPRSLWYMMSAAHNTVVVDGKNHRNLGGSYAEHTGFDGRPYGKTTLWADGKRFRAVRASGPEMVENSKQFERTVAMIDVSDQEFYVFDVFRVVGGSDHAKFLYSHFGTTTTSGLELKPAAEYGYNTQLRNFQTDRTPAPGWSVDWQIEDKYQLLPPGKAVRFRLTELTAGASASVMEAWISPGGAVGGDDGIWIPGVMARRQSQDSKAPLASTFISLLEPYEKSPTIAQTRRLPLQTPSGAAYPDANAAVEIRLADGRRDLLLTADGENPLGLKPSLAADRKLVQKDWNAELEGELAFARRAANGQLEQLVLCKARSLRIGETVVALRRPVDCLEIRFEKGLPVEFTGPAEEIDRITVNGKEIPLRRKR
jgi:hypothetical protein